MIGFCMKMPGPLLRLELRSVPVASCEHDLSSIVLESLNTTHVIRIESPINPVRSLILRTLVRTRLADLRIVLQDLKGFALGLRL